MDRYFKYLSPAGARPTLVNRTLRWSRPGMFNDLFDMSVPYSTTFDAQYVTQRALDLMWARIQKPGQQTSFTRMGAMLEVGRPIFLQLGRDQFDEEMRPAVEEALAKYTDEMDGFGKEIVAHLRTTKVLCLSRVHDDNTMWGIYANNHQGVVLEFSNVDEIDSPYRLAKPVTYSNRAPPLLDDERLASFLAGNINLTADLVDPLMVLKSEHWRYEQEVRLISGQGRNPDADFEDVHFHPRELIAVYFGARASQLRNEIEPLLIEKYPHAQRWQASQGQVFQISFTRLDALRD